MLCLGCVGVALHVLTKLDLLGVFDECSVFRLFCVFAMFGVCGVVFVYDGICLRIVTYFLYVWVYVTYSGAQFI